MMVVDVELNTDVELHEEEICMVRNGKNPYELRAELLVLAHRIAYDLNMSTVGGGSGVPPTTEQVIAEATKLNDFVSQRGAETHE